MLFLYNFCKWVGVPPQPKVVPFVKKCFSQSVRVGSKNPQKLLATLFALKKKRLAQDLLEDSRYLDHRLPHQNGASFPVSIYKKFT